MRPGIRMDSNDKSELQRLREETDLLKKELEIISALNAKITVDMDFDRVVDEIVHTIRRKVDFDGCNISIIDDNGLMRVHKISHSRLSKRTKATEEFLEKIYSQRIDYTISNEWSSRVAREKREIHYPEIKLEDFTPEERYLLENYGITSFYYLPIHLGHRVLGVMRFHNYGGTMYLSELEKDLIRKRASIVARALENQRLYTELKKKNTIIQLDNELAKRIQHTLIPGTLPKIKGIGISAVYLPMLEVGGDYYDFIDTGETGRSGLGVIMTDASGHGVSAAFITTMLKMIFQGKRSHALANDPSGLMHWLNDRLMGKIADNFVTGIYCYYDMEAMSVTIAGCGHNPLLIIDRNKETIEECAPSGRVLGLFENLEITEERLPLRPGLRFLLYTDGLIEATDREGKTFQEKVMCISRESVLLDKQAFLDRIVKELKAHSLFGSRTSLEDDTAIIVIDIL